MMIIIIIIMKEGLIWYKRMREKEYVLMQLSIELSIVLGIKLLTALLLWNLELGRSLFKLISIVVLTFSFLRVRTTVLVFLFLFYF